MTRLLIFVDWYLPGYKAGGQISSCANIVDALKDEVDIRIITRDRDLDDTKAYSGIVADRWEAHGSIQINYVSPGKANFRNFKKLIEETSPDTIYFNSMFSYRYTLLPLLVINSIKSKTKQVLAPRGMLQAGALQFKPVKKRAVLNLFYYMGMFKNILFHATDETEVTDIKKGIKGRPKVQLVYDFPDTKQQPFSGTTKEKGSLKCLFVSRIVQKKNLLYLLRAIAKTEKQIALTIAGPVEDQSYWNECQLQIKAWPPHCSADYIGSVPNNQLAEVYRQHHLFVLPTLGENFGHVIFDAFLNGRPVLISDQTPWRQLAEQKAGVEINLANEDQFLSALEHFADMDAETMNVWSNHAWMFGKKHVEKAKDLKNQYKLLFS